jgi:aspartyl-tRNA(Asn)/glutamyl-tRNA(Gln) amidotransferase subunit C
MIGDSSATGHGARVVIDAALIQQVARLARLEVDEASMPSLVVDLERMVSALNQLAKVDVDGIEPMVLPDSDWPAMRADVVGPCLARDVLHAMAPDFRADGFVVPRVVE